MILELNSGEQVALIEFDRSKFFMAVPWRNGRKEGPFSAPVRIHYNEVRMILEATNPDLEIFYKTLGPVPFTGKMPSWYLASEKGKEHDEYNQTASL